MLRDPTQRSHAQAALNAVGANFTETDLSGCFRFLSAGWAELLGLPVDELVGRSAFDFLHPDDIPVAQAAMAEAMDGRTVRSLVLRFVHVGGAVRHLRFDARREGEVFRALVIDATGVVEERRAHAESRQLVELAQELAELAHWRMDVATGAMQWSRKLFEIYRLPPDGPVPSQEQLAALRHPEDGARLERDFREAIAEGRPYDTEVRIFVGPAREVRRVRSRGIVEVDAAGQPTSVFGVVQDVTEERRMQSQLRDAERLASITTLSAGIAHEINNPLQYLMGNLEMLNEGLADLAGVVERSQLDALEELVSDCFHGVRQVRRTVQDLRFFSRGAAGASDRQLLPPGELLDAAVGMTRSRLRQSVALEQHVAPTARVRVATIEMVQVFVNLITNALHACEQRGMDGRLVLRCYQRPGDPVVLEVEDNGPGVPEELQRRIFEPFFTTKPKGVGTGLGLHICRSIVDEHGGSLTVTSRPGQTTFTVSLPAGEDHRPAVLRPASAPRVLVVDDDERVGRAFARMLASRYQVELEVTAARAFERVLAEDFQAMVCDVAMPGMTGWDCIRRLEQQRPGFAARVVMVSGSAGPDDRPDDVPEMVFLEKPFGPNALRDAVAAALARPPAAAPWGR